MLVAAPKTLNYPREARAFFVGLSEACPERLQALQNEGAYDAKLTVVVWESRDWIAREHIREARGLGYGREKALAKQRTNSLLGLYREDAKRNYVTLPNRVALPPPRIHEASTADGRVSDQKATAFFAGLERATPARLVALGRELRGNEQLWRLMHPENGRATATERAAIFASRSRIGPMVRTQPKPGTYRRGRVSPVGMTDDRALELAVRAEAQREQGRASTSRRASALSPDLR